MKIDSPLVKCFANQRPTRPRARLSTQETEWETLSEQSDGNCGYDPDSESDEEQFSRSKSPEILRESCVRSDFGSSASPVPRLLSLKRKRSLSISNIEHLLEEDSIELVEDYTNSVHILASTLIDGRKSEAGRLEFVTDVSSVHNRDSPDKVNFDNILSLGSSSGVKIEDSEKAVEGEGLPGVGRNTKHREKGKNRKGKLSLKRRKEGETSLIKHKSSFNVENRDIEEVISENSSVGTPQNQNILTLNRNERSSENLKSRMENTIKVNDGSDDDLIILDSNDTSPPKSSKPKKSKRRIQRNIELAAVDDCVKLCEFPVGKSDTVTVAIQDYATLEHDTFLNDIIIDFYLTYLRYTILPIEDRTTVHIFSTMFYKRLMQAPKKNAKKVASYETDPALTSAEKRQFRVAGWTKSVDLFDKDLLIIPICEHSHWYLLLVVKPGLITSPVRSEERAMLGEPFIIVLDSMGGTKDSAVRNIRQYLACEWTKKKCGGDSDTEEYSFSGAEMRTVRPMKPEQENYSDCGIFLLHYVEKVFNSVAQFFWPSLPDLSDWFTIDEVGRKRGEISDLIKCLATEQNPGKTIQYPKINFSAARKPRKRQKPIVESSSSEEDEEAAEVRSQGKFASAVNSSRNNVARSKRHRSRKPPPQQGIATDASTSTAGPSNSASTSTTGPSNSPVDCEISNVVCVSPKIRNKAKNSNVPVTSEGKTGNVLARLAGVALKPSDALKLKKENRKEEVGTLDSFISPFLIDSSVDAKNSSNCDKTRVPELKTNSCPAASLTDCEKESLLSSKEKKRRKLRADQFLADLEVIENEGIEEDEEAMQSMDNRMNKNGSLRDISSKQTTPNPNVHVIPPDKNDSGNERNLSKILGKTLEQLSPNVKSSHGRGRLASDSPLFTSPGTNLKSSKSIKDNRLKDVSRISVESNGEPSTSETSAELFTPGLRGGSHTVAHNSREEIKAKSRIKELTTKKFTLATKNPKLSRYEETDSQKTFNKFLFATSSEGDSDIFSQENE